MREVLVCSKSTMFNKRMRLGRRWITHILNEKGEEICDGTLINGYATTSPERSASLTHVRRLAVAAT